MSKESSSSSSSGIGFFGLLGIVFITLKLCHIIDWSWWWVTAPLWGGLALVLLLLLVVFVVSAWPTWRQFKGWFTRKKDRINKV